MTSCLITGINGQDGSLLAEYLLSLGYEVHGIIRRTSNIKNIKHIKNQLKLHVGDLTDSGFIYKLINHFKPNEIYNLAGQSHVGHSFESPQLTINVNTLGVLNILEAIVNIEKECKLYQASTSEMFDGRSKCPYNEHSRFNPLSPYGSSKLQAHNLIKIYREAYGLFCCSGISFNHESTRRGHDFVTRKITKWFKEEYYNYLRGFEFERLILGNVNASRDWGHAKEYVKAFHKMLQSPKPKDYIISTGKCNSVKKIIDICFNSLNKKIEWETTSLGECGKVDGIDFIYSDRRKFRPTEIDYLCGDSKKIYEDLGWSATLNIEDIILELLNDT
jgi:GDPmannose 4,6-dehydratase